MTPCFMQMKSKEVTIYFHVSYYDNKVCSLIKSCISKIRSNCEKEHLITSKFLHDVTNIDFFCSPKDKTPTLNQSYSVYGFVCPGCSANYAWNFVLKTCGTCLE